MRLLFTLLLVPLPAVAEALCEAHGGLPGDDDTTKGMVRLEGGTFTIGDDDERPEERTAHPANVSPFWTDHPVVQVAHADALAYAEWLGHDLPTEAECEFAARGGHEGATYSWGETYDPLDGWKAKTWQGAFPVGNENQDGHHGTAPVGCFEANGYRLYDMAGNVWEYARDFYLPGQFPGPDPAGPSAELSARYSPTSMPRVTVKGGSWLCAPNFCMRYRPAGRQPQEPDLDSNHIGFRTVLRQDNPSPL